ncbi:unnamed protein product, partial [Mesorhabditis spiculigera]
MGVQLVISLYTIMLSPAFVLFIKLVSGDPLRIILFALGAFFWLLALLGSGIFWFAVWPLRDWMSLSLCVMVITQELARIALFHVIKKAQHGFNQMAHETRELRQAGGNAPVVRVTPPAFHDLHNARHLLAVVTGLGQGVVAALFMNMNIFAALSGPGSIGLPYLLNRDSTKYFMEPDRTVPYYFAICGMFVTLLNAMWSIQIWDSCHKFYYRPQHCKWYEGAVVAILTHLALSGMSFMNRNGYQLPYLAIQLFFFFGIFLHVNKLMGGNFGSFLAWVYFMFRDWVKLLWLRQQYCKLMGKPLPEASPRGEDQEMVNIRLHHETRAERRRQLGPPIEC